MATPIFACQTILLSWDHATTREDGSLITGQKSYNLYYKLSSVETEEKVTLSGETLSYVIDCISPDVYEFGISTAEDGFEGKRYMITFGPPNPPKLNAIIQR